MRKQVAALALSMVLCCGSSMPSLALAAPPKASANKGPLAPSVLKTAITQNNTHVELTMGKAQVIKLNMPATRISISDPEAVGLVMLSPTEIQLIGKTLGAANLLVWSEKTGNNYLVIDLSVHRDVSALASKIQMIDPGINILPVAAEDSVILTGVAESMDRAQLAYDLTKAFFAEDAKGDSSTSAEVSSNSPGSASIFGNSTKIINMIRVVGQPSTKADMVQERLCDIDPNIKLKVVPGFGGKEKAILTGRVRNASMVSKAVNLTSVFYGTPGIKLLTGPGGNVVKEGKDAEASGGFEAGTGGGLIGNLTGNILHGSIITDTSGNVISMMEVEEHPQIKCTIKFLEVQKSLAKQYGFNYFVDGNTVKLFTQNGVGVNPLGGVNGFITSTPSVAGQAQMGIRFGQDFAMLISGLIAQGKAKVLAEPTIISNSGEPASFISGGEFPIPVIGTNGGVSVVFKEFGIRLDLLATVTEQNTIHMQVSPEVSSLDRANGIDLPGGVGSSGSLRIPGLRTRRGQSVLEMNNGDNFVLGGLYSQDMNDAYNKIPLLGQIPILGQLFQSRNFQQNETELLIVIHPEIQSQMNLSSVESRENSAHIAQTIRLDPEKVFQELASKGKNSAKAKTVTWDATQMKPTETQSATVNTPPALPTGEVTDAKAAKKAMRDLKREQKRMVREARRLARAQKPANNAASQVPAPQSATVTPAFVPAADYLKRQQMELSEVLRHLEESGPSAEPVSVGPVTQPQSPLKAIEPVLPSQAAKPVESRR